MNPADRQFAQNLGVVGLFLGLLTAANSIASLIVYGQNGLNSMNTVLGVIGMCVNGVSIARLRR
jgi:hypothetical protein